MEIGRKGEIPLSARKKGLIRLYQTYALNMVELRGFEPRSKIVEHLAFYMLILLKDLVV